MFMCKQCKMCAKFCTPVMDWWCLIMVHFELQFTQVTDLTLDVSTCTHCRFFSVNSTGYTWFFLQYILFPQPEPVWLDMCMFGHYLTLMTCTEWKQPGLHCPDSSCWLPASHRLPNDLSWWVVFKLNNLRVGICWFIYKLSESCSQDGGACPRVWVLSRMEVVRFCQLLGPAPTLVFKHFIR